MSRIAIELTNVTKAYGALRPLRVARLSIAEGERVALVLGDRPAAEVLVGLLTGAALPDAGVVRILGRETSTMTESAEWLSFTEQFGIASDRAPLLEASTVLQNLILPFSLEIDAPEAEARNRAEKVAREVGLPVELDHRPVGTLDGRTRACVRLGRALAFAPAVLILEHLTQSVPEGEVSTLGRQFHQVLALRGATTLALTADSGFAAAVADRVLWHDPATGRLSARRGWWFSR